MSLDFEDLQLTQRVGKILFNLIKEELNGEKIAKIKIATDTQVTIYTMIRLKAGHLLGKQ